jgi:hypothetical protein
MTRPADIPMGKTMRLSFILAGASCSLLVATATAQGFASNCTASKVGWNGVYLNFFVAHCLDHAGVGHASFISLDDCVTNSEGRLLGKPR